MEEPKYACKRTKIDHHVYGLGLLLQFFYNHFFFNQFCLFVVGCFFYHWGYTFPLFLFIIVQGICIWFQHKAPLVDAARRQTFNKWVKDSMIQAGSESCNFLNELLKACWEKMLPDSFGDSICPYADRAFANYVPFFVNYLHFTHFSFGYHPLRILQVVSDQTAASEQPANTISLQAAAVVANELRIQCTFKLFKLIPCDLYFDDIALYAPVRVIVESPEQNIFLNTSIITAIAFTAIEPVVLLHANIYFNGFNVSKIPLVGYLIGLFVETQANSIVSKGQCVVWDWITNSFFFRHLTRSSTQDSEELFKGIATKNKRFESLKRFSMPNDAVERYDKTRKMYWERTKNAKLEPNEKLIQMDPPHGVETEPVFKYREEKNETTDKATQTPRNNTKAKPKTRQISQSQGQFKSQMKTPDLP